MVELMAEPKLWPNDLSLTPDEKYEHSLIFPYVYVQEPINNSIFMIMRVNF